MTVESDCKKLSSRALKKVMVRKPKIFKFFSEKLTFLPKLALRLAKTALKHLILGKTDQRKRSQKSL